MNVPTCVEMLTATARWALQNSSAAALLSLAAVGLWWLMRRRWSARWTYAVGLLVLIRLLLPITPTSSWSWRNWQPVRETSTVAESQVSVPLVTTMDAAPMQSFPEGEILPLPTANVAPEPISRTVSWSTILSAIWAAGVGGLLVFVGWSHFRFARRVRCRAVPAGFISPALLAECRALTDVRRSVPVRSLAGLGSPAVFGFLRPQILLPAELAGKLTESEWRHVLLHELAHVKARDVLVNWLIILARTLHWFNPLAWAATHRLVEDREMLRDAQALTWLGKGRVGESYGHTLLKLAALRVTPPVTPSLAPLFHNRQELERRILMIKHPSPQHQRWLATLISSSLLTLLCLVTFTTAGAEEKSADSSKAAPSERDPAKAIAKPLVRSAAATDLLCKAIESRDQGDYKVAQQLLEEILKLEPDNQFIPGLIESFHKSQLDSENVSAGAKGAEQLVKIKALTLPEISLHSATLEDSIRFLREQSVALDPAKEGINFILQLKGKPDLPKVTLEQKGMPMLDAVRQMCLQTGNVWRVDSHAVVITSSVPPRLETRVFRCPDALANTLGTVGPSLSIDWAALGLPTVEGRQENYLPGSQRLIVKNSVGMLDLMKVMVDRNLLPSAALKPSEPPPRPTATAEQLRKRIQITTHVCDAPPQSPNPPKETKAGALGEINSLTGIFSEQQFAKIKDAISKSNGQELAALPPQLATTGAVVKIPLPRDLGGGDIMVQPFLGDDLRTLDVSFGDAKPGKMPSGSILTLWDGQTAGWLNVITEQPVFRERLIFFTLKIVDPEAPQK